MSTPKRRFNLLSLTFIVLNCHKHVKFKLFAKFKNIRWRVFWVMLNFSKYRVALNIMLSTETSSSGTMTKIASFLSQPFWNISKQTSWAEKLCLLFSNIPFHFRDIQVFKICKLAKWWHHTLNQVLLKYDEKRYLSQFVSQMFGTLQ